LLKDDLEWPFKENLVVLQDEKIPLMETFFSGGVSLQNTALVAAVMFAVRRLASDLIIYLLPVF